MRGGGFPGRAAGCLSLLLYSPAQDGKHIKCFPLRAELATNLNSGPPGPGIRRTRRGNVTCQKGTGLFWSVLSGETSRSGVFLLSLLYANRRCFRKYAVKNELAEHTGVLQ